MSAIRNYSVNVHLHLETSGGFKANFPAIEPLRDFLGRGWTSRLVSGWSRVRACLALPPARDNAALRRNRDAQASQLADPWRGKAAKRL